MKKFFFLIVLFYLAGVSFLYPERNRILKSKNDFGGPTYEVKYSAGDRFYDELEIERAVVYYDQGNEIVMVEYYFRPEFVKRRNYEKKIEYYGKGHKVNKAEYFYTKKFSEEKGIYKVIDIINTAGEVVQVLFFYTDKFTSKYGFINSIMYLANGYITRIEYYYKEDFEKKYGYKVREDKYVYDAQGNKKVTVSIFYDANGKEVNRIENPTNLIEPER